MKNPVFRSVEHKAQPVLPMGWGEVSSAIFVAASGVLAGWPFVGLVAAALVWTAFALARRTDARRNDYLKAGLRRAVSPHRAYQAWDSAVSRREEHR